MILSNTQDAIRLMHNKENKRVPPLAASVVRAVFHDAIDLNNLLVKNSAGVWEPFGGADGYGGVDGCLYSPLTGGTTGRPKPNHNRNIPREFPWALDICTSLCQGSLAGVAFCSHGVASCVVDITVLASLVVIENHGGPRMPMVWGRQKGNCDRMVVTPFTKDQDDLVTYGEYPALRFAPALTGIDDPTSFRMVFQDLGFNAVEQTALMGAHSFGQLQVCAGGLNGVERGPFCSDPALLHPPLSDSNMSPQCQPQFGSVSNCWREQPNGELRPVFAGMRGDDFENEGDDDEPEDDEETDDNDDDDDDGDDFALKVGFGDGGFWDQTPMRFDNDYYKHFSSNQFGEKDNCCGKMKRGQCHRRGRMVRISERDSDGRGVATEEIVGGSCSVEWCRSDRKGRTHMKSTKTWHEAPHDFVKKAWHHGPTKRMIRLAGDWALLGSEETSAAVGIFASDQDAFFDAFAGAWAKVISKGQTELESCTSSGEEPMTNDYVQYFYAALTCQDSASCRADHVCTRPNIRASCPRKCGMCPDQL